MNRITKAMTTYKETKNTQYALETLLHGTCAPRYQVEFYTTDSNKPAQQTLPLLDHTLVTIPDDSCYAFRIFDATAPKERTGAPIYFIEEESMPVKELRFHAQYDGKKFIGENRGINGKSTSYIIDTRTGHCAEFRSRYDETTLENLGCVAPYEQPEFLCKMSDTTVLMRRGDVVVTLAADGKLKPEVRRPTTSQALQK